MTSIPVIAVPHLRLSTPADHHLPAYDFTLLSAVNTCPKWGVIRYEHGKAMPGAYRPVALEMGAMMHEAFAVCRLGNLIDQGLYEHAGFNADRLFGHDRAVKILDHFSNTDPANHTPEQYYRACLESIESFGWEDSPFDKRRTMVNAQDALALYVDDWCSRDRMRVWVSDRSNPHAPAGVEIKFDMVLSFRVTLPVLAQFAPPPICISNVDSAGATISFRYIGRMDGLMEHGDPDNPILYVHENKTAGRIDDAWRQSYLISHQITGYCVAGSLYSSTVVRNAYAIGLVVPRPKRDSFNGIVYEHVMRENYNIERWLQWVLHSCEVIWRWAGDPLNAPMYSHSCNRYFRPCAYIPLCYAEPEEQTEIYAEMVDDKWSPLREFNQKADNDGAS